MNALLEYLDLVLQGKWGGGGAMAPLGHSCSTTYGCVHCCNIHKINVDSSKFLQSTKMYTCKLCVSIVAFKWHLRVERDLIIICCNSGTGKASLLHEQTGGILRPASNVNCLLRR